MQGYTSTSTGAGTSTLYTIACNSRRFPTHSRRFVHPCEARRFASGKGKGNNYYDVLAIPSSATEAQIKTSFYQLSKKYHPDVASDPAAHVKFHAISEAYSVLGNDRKRREYNRTLQLPSSAPARSQTQHPQATTRRPSSQPGHSRTNNPWQAPNHPRARSTNGNVKNETWERGYDGKYMYYRPPEGMGAGKKKETASSQARSRPQRDPFLSPHVQRATGRTSRSTSTGSQSAQSPSSGAPNPSSQSGYTGDPDRVAERVHRPERPATDEDAAAGESGVVRAFVVTVMVAVIMVIPVIATGGME
ncbi:hypothetical protein BJ138DRAFT_1104175 [Hygrophoropsis aurantiaca]|uniref:Uncharacterized protein n=1 Tax=Hygrophoropsis aurantiaca TaxID=72124 RepID=A0ACB8A2K1_9AGAM|nr:hypothetical protein BJ138DRAFT_1104175 [Hygrophoropsis aurantiaca]